MKNEWDGLNQEADVLIEKGEYKTALIKAKKAFELAEQSLGPTHTDVLEMMLKLASIHYELKQLEKAKPLLNRAKRMTYITLAPYIVLDDGSEPDPSPEQWEKAEQLLKNLLVTTEKVYGPDDIHVARVLTRYALNYSVQGNDDKAESLYERALEIVESIYGNDNPEIEVYVDELGSHYYGQGKYEKAEPLFKRSLALREKSDDLGGSRVYMSLVSLAGLYRNMGKQKEAKEAAKRAAEIRAKRLIKKELEL